MKGTKQIRLSLIAVVLCAVMLFSACSHAGISFGFSSYKTVDSVPYSIFFDEGYFDEPASVYNPSLASASACLALAGFSAATGDDYSASDVHARELFKTLGFEHYLPNGYGVSKPTPSSFGVYIASRKMNGYTLIGIAVRGAGYMSEWASNFKLGSDPEFAEGFYEASEIYLDFLREYIDKYDVSGRIKIWTAGYSRGGAVVNIAAGRIDDGLVAGKNILSDRVEYGKDDVYAYSFEAPAGKVADTDVDEIFEKGINYSNIFTVLNLNDPVPFVAPREYGFVRYGTDLFLPDIITDLNYASHVDTVKKRMTELPNYATVGDYSIDAFADESLLSFMNDVEPIYVNMTPHVFLNDFIEVLCQSVGSREKYVEVFEKPVTQLFAFLYSFLTPKESAINLLIDIGKEMLHDDPNEVFLFDLQNNQKRFLADFEPLIYKSFEKYNVNVSRSDIKGMLGQILKLFVNILISEDGPLLLRPVINGKNVGILGSAHVPELLLSHVTALDPNYEKTSLTVRKSYDYLNVDTADGFRLIIDGEEYAAVSDGSVRARLVVKKTASGYRIYLPEDAEFRLESDGELSYELYSHNNCYLHDRLIGSGTAEK